MTSGNLNLITLHVPTVSPWVLLLLAIGAEVIGTSCLKLSEGFTKPGPTLVVLLAYGWCGAGESVACRARRHPSFVIDTIWRHSSFSEPLLFH